MLRCDPAENTDYSFIFFGEALTLIFTRTFIHPTLTNFLLKATTGNLTCVQPQHRNTVETHKRWAQSSERRISALRSHSVSIVLSAATQDRDAVSPLL